MTGTTAGRVLVVGPPPLLAVSLGTRPDGAGDTIDLDAAGQAVWAARAAVAVGAGVTIVGLAGGPREAVLRGLLRADGIETQLVATAAGGVGSYVLDRRQLPPTATAIAWANAPSDDEVAALVQQTRQAAVQADVVVVGNAMPEHTLPLEVYPRLVEAGHEAGAAVVVDLSSPRLDAALAATPEVVKVNDWELAESVAGPVDTPASRQAAAERLVHLGAGAVVVTRGPNPVLVLHPPDDPVELVPPRLGPGDPAGCGDTLSGALAAALAQGRPWLEAVTIGVAAGCARYTRPGRPLVPGEVDRLVPDVTVRRAPA
jgi:fructose-1-phosphate kinase PfkB-like protein